MEDELPNQGEDESEINVANPPAGVEKAAASENAINEKGDSKAKMQDESVSTNDNSIKNRETDIQDSAEENSSLLPANKNGIEDESRQETPATEAANAPKFCTKCGAPLNGDSAFCAKCGSPANKTDNKESAIAPAKPEQENNSEKTKEKASFIKKFGTKKIGAIAVVAIVVIAALLIVPPMLRTPDELFAAGEYKAAYEKSAEDEKPEMLGKIIEKGKYDIAYSLATSDDEKKKVLLGTCSAGKFEDALQLAETTEQKDMISFVNGIAYVFKTDCLENLKDSDSFVLKKAWYGGREKGIALQVQASNSYGQPVQNYYYFKYSSDKGRYEYSNSVSSLKDETIYKYADDWDEKLEKALDNATRSSLRKLTVESYAVDPDVVDAINNLFKATKFKDITLAPDLSIKEFGTLSGGEGAA